MMAWQSEELAREYGMTPSKANRAAARSPPPKRPPSPVPEPLTKRRSCSRVSRGYAEDCALSDPDSQSAFGGEASDSDFKLSDTATGANNSTPHLH